MLSFYDSAYFIYILLFLHFSYKFFLFSINFSGPGVSYCLGELFFAHVYV